MYLKKPCQVKGAQGRGLDYGKFLEYLYNIGAQRFFQIDVAAFSDLRGRASMKVSKPTKGAAKGSSGGTKVQDKGIQILMDKIKIEKYRYGRQVGRSALIMRVIME